MSGTVSQAEWSLGRGYLSPEPLLQNPAWAASQLRSGRQVLAYGYGGNNPVVMIDPNGLDYLFFNGRCLYWMYQNRSGTPIAHETLPATSGRTSGNTTYEPIPQGHYP